MLIRNGGEAQLIPERLFLLGIIKDADLQIHGESVNTAGVQAFIGMCEICDQVSLMSAMHLAEHMIQKKQM